MQIGIVGLLPEQVRIVQQEFPQHSLRFLSKDRESETNAFTKGCDKVVLMTNFIGHHMQDRVPLPKRVFCSGGMTKLRNTLKSLPAIKGQPPMTTAQPQTAKPSAPADDAVDWSPFDAALNVGDEIRIARPKRITIAAFDVRITAGRSYRKKHHGVTTTPQKMVDGFAVMRVKAIEKQPVAAVETPTAHLVPAPQPESTAMQLITRDTQATTQAPTLANPRESAFWQSVFVETLKQWPGAPIHTIAQRADEAMQAYACRAVSALNSSH